MRSGCKSNAVKTLTYIYSDSTAVLGPLATYAEPHAYDLCIEHAERLTVPQGWIVIQHDPQIHDHEPSPEDLLAIAEAVRQTAKVDLEPQVISPDVGRRGHLRVIPYQQ